MSSASSSFAAAGVAAAIELSIMSPLDVVKTRLQLPQSPTGQRWTGLLQALRGTVANEGLMGLWRGFGPGLCIVVPRRGIKFAANSSFRSVLGDGAAASLVAGGAAGACEAVLITPLETVKVALQSAQRSTSATHVASTLWRAGGLTALYAGLSATVAKHTAHSMCYFAVFQQAQGRARRLARSRVGGDLAAGFAAGVAAGTANNPFDVVKTRVQVTATAGATGLPAVAAAGAELGLAGSLLALARREGAAALFQGWTAKVARLGPGSAIIFAVYHAVYDGLVGSGT